MDSDPASSRPLLDKLGVKPGMSVCLVRLEEARDFRRLLDGRSVQIQEGQPEAGTDLIFFGASRPEDLSHLTELRRSLKPNGAIWAVTPRGRPEIKDTVVIRAAKAAGLVDVKVVRFSDTHTALRLVIPLALRGRVWPPTGAERKSP